MRHRSGYMFTNKKHPKQGILSFALGAVAIAGINLAIMLSYRSGGSMNARYGLASLFAFIISIVGFTFGARGKMEKDIFNLFPVLGLVCNTITIIEAMFIIYAGVYGL